MLLPRVSDSLRDEIAATPRGRLLVAMADVVGEKGYAAATVADVIAAAGASRKTFYAHFADKEACLLAAYEHGCAALGAEMAGAAAVGADPVEAMRAALRTFLEALAAEPGFARTFLVEAWAAGPAAYERHLGVINGFHALLRALHDRALAEGIATRAASDSDIAAVIGGISRVATLRVLAGRADELPELTDDLLDFGLRSLAA